MRHKKVSPQYPKPFLKWAGGKGQLLPVLIPKVDAAGTFRRYHEPFIGGGALFFELYRTGRLAKSRVYLSDSNDRLMDAYRGIKNDVEGVIELLTAHAARHSSEYFYEVRANVPKDPIERAARIIYLNRTCYNGLFRENSKGLFNVPFGKYTNPLICHEENLRAVAAALANAELETRGFESVLDIARKGDLVYFDPPYDPLSKTSSFTAYGKGGFGDADQRKLAGIVDALAKKGVKVLLSNSNTQFTQSLYRTFSMQTVNATRMINSKAEKRGKIEEILVSNYE